MASRLARIIRRRAASASVILAFVPCSVANAQTDEATSAQAAEDVHAAEAAANDPSAAAPSAEAESPAPSEPRASGAPNTASSGFPKTLTPQQRLPENLQGWMRERTRGHSGLAERPALPAEPFRPVPAADATEPAYDGYKRRLHSFNEDGVTVLSNRRAPPSLPLARVEGAAAVVVPAARPVLGEPDLEESTVTARHSLRTNQLNAHLPSDHGLGWPVFAVPVAAISLTLLWLRRRRMAG